MRLGYWGARYFDPEVGVWTSCDRAEQFHNPYAYSTNPSLMVDEDGNFFWIPILVSGVVNAGVDLSIQLALKGDWSQVEWGSVVTSGIAGAATCGLGQAAALGKLGATLGSWGFEGLFSRSLLNSVANFGIRSLGISYDSQDKRLKNYDAGRMYNSLAISSLVGFGSALAQGAVNNYWNKVGWDPSFEKVTLDFAHGDGSWSIPRSWRIDPNYSENDFSFYEKAKNTLQQQVLNVGSLKIQRTLEVRAIYEMWQYVNWQDEGQGTQGQTFTFPNQESTP